MASLKRLSTDNVRADYWDERLGYYRRLLAAHGRSFWPARFAATALDLMAKHLTKATTSSGAADAAASSVGGHGGLGGLGGGGVGGGAGAGGGGASAAASTSDGFSSGLIDAFMSTETSWSGLSYDIFPHNLTGLSEADFSSTDWTASGAGPVDDLQWQSL